MPDIGMEKMFMGEKTSSSELGGMDCFARTHLS